MKNFDIEAKLHIQKDLKEADALTDKLWSVFSFIHHQYQDEHEADNYLEKMRSPFNIFISNRLSDHAYLFDYINVIKLLNEAKIYFPERTEQDFLEELYSSRFLTHYPPNFNIDRLREVVFYEFIRLYLAVGGFKAFDAASVNYPGYIAGTNQANHTPYHQAGS